MGKYRDLTGQRFGRLTVISRAANTKRGNAGWLCKCDCGNEATTTGPHLISGHTKSCGCYRVDRSKETNRKHGLFVGSTHKRPRIYGIWARMKQRCLDPNVSEYGRYGGRGIKVCNEWMEFIPFRDWALANGYSDDLSIERIDNDGNYEPSNCKWIPQREQIKNSTSNKFITYNGQTKNIKEWATSLGIPYPALLHRIRKRWAIERAFTQAVRADRRRRAGNEQDKIARAASS